MVESMIVTVTDRSTGRHLDIEVSATLSARLIAQLLGDAAAFGYGDVAHALYSTKLARALKPEETLGDLGLWEGSELWVIPYATSE